MFDVVNSLHENVVQEILEWALKQRGKDKEEF